MVLGVCLKALQLQGLLTPHTFRALLCTQPRLTPPKLVTPIPATPSLGCVSLQTMISFRPPAPSPHLLKQHLRGPHWVGGVDDDDVVVVGRGVLHELDAVADVQRDPRVAEPNRQLRGGYVKRGLQVQQATGMRTEDHRRWQLAC